MEFCAYHEVISAYRHALSATDRRVECIDRSWITLHHAEKARMDGEHPRKIYDATLSMLNGKNKRVKSNAIPSTKASPLSNHPAKAFGISLQW